ncbi:gem-associated protein 4 [Engraulis encrasicolus]|uniref:gem-associated protein 4 n=1 Tax=Engraulis encrasicolus TaxID=184585 RepID=UPI002FD0AED7
MREDPWLKGEMVAILQGGFLLANKLCEAASLDAAKKEEWGTVGRPIIDSIKEVCGQGHSESDKQTYWGKRVLCIIWSKLLEKERAKDVETSWKENELFSVLSQLPDVNRTVLFEVIKSMDFCKLYMELLLCLPPNDLCVEVERLVEYVSKDTSAEDVRLLMEVWRGLWRGDWGGTGETFSSIFTEQFSDTQSQPSKRTKLDPDTLSSSDSAMAHLFRAVREIKDVMNSPDECCLALSNCLDSLYSSYVLQCRVKLSAREKLERLSVEVARRKECNSTERFDLVKAICEAQKDLAAVETPSKVKPAGLTLTKAVETILCLLQVWEDKGLLKAGENFDHCRNTVALSHSIHRVLLSLENYPAQETELKETINRLKNALKKISEFLIVNEPTKKSSEMASIAMAVIDNRLEGFQLFAPLFVAEFSWALDGSEWISCLERNKTVFKQRELLMKLVSILIAKCQTDEDTQHCKRLKDLLVVLFCELSMSDKNDALGDMIKLSTKGLHGHLPQALTAGFSEELNLAFNRTIQGGAKSNLDSAASAIARVAFQNPEATLRQCCQLAVVNLGAHVHLSKILKRLPGLGAQQPISGERGKSGGESLLCRCMQDIVADRLSSSQEQEQFLQFLVALMEPPSGDLGKGFVSPHEIFQAFILPCLARPRSHPFSLELCLRLLQSTLLLKPPSDGSTHWIMGCSPFPLLYCLCQLLSNSSRCWENDDDDDTSEAAHVSMEAKEVLTSVIGTLSEAVGEEVTASPSTWSRALFWLYSKVEALEWTVRFHLKALWGDHFKNEVPSALLEVCELPEQEWSGTKLAQYGQGTGLVAWLECCALSDPIQKTMLDHLSLDVESPDTVGMFSKGLLVALSQTLPWCTLGEWARIVRAVKQLLLSGRLHVPYSLEYVEFLPLLDLRAFAYELRMSVLLLRVFQLLCGASCADWLPPPGWAHVARLYASTVREALDSLRTKVQADVPKSGGEGVQTGNNQLEASRPGGEGGTQEGLFVLSQLFCHVMHVQVMTPGGQTEPLFLCALEILTIYEAIQGATTHSKMASSVESENTRHFLKTITDNLHNEHMKSVLQQKIAQL